MYTSFQLLYGSPHNIRGVQHFEPVARRASLDDALAARMVLLADVLDDNDDISRIATLDLGALELSEDRCEKFRNGLYEHLQSERTALGYTFMNRLWLLIDLLHVEGACCVFCRAAWIENLKLGREEAWSRAAYGVMMMSESVGVTE